MRTTYTLLAAALLSAAVSAADHSPIAAVRFSPNGSTLALAGGESIRLVPTAGAGAFEAKIQTKLAQVMDVAWAPDGPRFAAAGGTPGVAGQVEVWDVATKRAMYEVRPFRDLAYAAAFSPDGKRLAVGGAEGTIRILDAASGETNATLTGHSGPVLCLAWSPDGAVLASGSGDRSVRIWDAAKGELARALTNHAGAVQAIAFSRDGQTLYSASSDATVRVWVPAVGRMKRIVRGFGLPVLGLAYSAARNRLLAGIADGSARIVDAESGDIVKTIPAAQDARPAWLHAVAVSPDGAWAALADAAGRYRLMRFPE